MPSSRSLKTCCKTVRKMGSSTSLPTMPGSRLRLLLLFPTELPKQNQGIVTVMETQRFCQRVLNLGAWEATARAEVPIPNATRERWLGSLPSRASAAQSNGHKGRCWRGSFSVFPLSQTGFQSLRKVLLSLVPFIIFTLGHVPFSSRKRQEDSPRLLESVADNTLHLKFLLIFCLDTL